jgi:hypothetical protein
VLARLLRPSDIPKLRTFYETSGLPYEFPDLSNPLIEAVHVVADEHDEPLCAAVAERIPQIYFIAGPFGPSHARLHAMRLLHESMGADLKRKGYTEANAFLTVPKSTKFGHWLERRFGWVRNRDSWCKRL